MLEMFAACKKKHLFLNISLHFLYSQIVMDNNTYHICKCIYLNIGYISCKICAQWVNNTVNDEPKVEPIIFGKRWSRSNDFNKIQNKA